MRRRIVSLPTLLMAVLALAAALALHGLPAGPARLALLVPAGLAAGGLWTQATSFWILR